MSKEIECYQCMDKGLLLIPLKGKNGMTYEYMFQCSCRRGKYFTQLPPIDIQNDKNREYLKYLAEKNYQEKQNSKEVKK